MDAPPASPWAAVDWTRPWYAGWRQRAESAHAALRDGSAAWKVLDDMHQAPVRFVPAHARPRGVGYEAHIEHSGGCPTGDHWHDLFNGLCWMRFPRAKAGINRLHASALAAAQPGATRDRLRDALTLLDENGALVQAPTPIWQALHGKDWPALFGSLRPLWRQVRVDLFGHALLDKLRAPRKAITAHVLRLPAGIDDDGAMDGWLERLLASRTLLPGDFCHLPVLGVPGWWPANEDQGFYQDPSVFRTPSRSPGSPRRRRPLRPSGY